jgi:hypothetical protein
MPHNARHAAAAAAAVLCVLCFLQANEGLMRDLEEYCVSVRDMVTLTPL